MSIDRARMRTALLNAANEEELSDLAVWLESHPDEVTHENRFEAIDWLHRMMDETAAYPCSIAVPSHLIDAIDGVIEDWIEVLTSHDESFLTDLVIQ
jgi:uncharacterized protein (DUF2342 family)